MNDFTRPHQKARRYWRIYICIKLSSSGVFECVSVAYRSGIRWTSFDISWEDYLVLKVWKLFFGPRSFTLETQSSLPSEKRLTDREIVSRSRYFSTHHTNALHTSCVRRPEAADILERFRKDKDSAKFNFGTWLLTSHTTYLTCRVLFFVHITRHALPLTAGFRGNGNSTRGKLS